MNRNVLIILVILIAILGFYFILNKNPKIMQVSETQTSSQDQTPKTAVFATNLEVPWAIAFLPDGRMLVTERPGRVRIVDKNGNVSPTPATTINVKVERDGEGGLLGIVLSPQFSQNHFVYLYYTYESGNGDTLNRVVRARFENNKLSNEQIIVDKIPGAIYHNGGRIKFGPDGFLYITTGDARNSNAAQDKNSLAGKILRVTEDGKGAPDNPFKTQVYSYGHRNPQGIAWDVSGNLWETEHGPSGIWPNCCQDEINRIEKRANYGWSQSVGDTVRAGTIGPVLHSGRDIWAPSGTAIVGNSVFFAGLRGNALYEYKIDSKKLIEHFKSEYGRLREVILGPDNMLYITTSNRDGRGIIKENDDKIIRINPSKLRAK